MPELPEVETVKRQLGQKLPLQVKRVKLSPVVKSILKRNEIALEKTEIESVERVGKLLQFKTSKGWLLSHLGMSGAWLVSHKPLEEKHLHVEIKGESSEGPLYFSYVDPRRFGKMYLVKDKDPYLKNIGVDISTSDFNQEYLKKVLKKYPERKLKVFLLDQKYFAGSGNYIANEICARAGIRPTRRAGKVTLKEQEKIIKATKIVLDGSLATNGLTFQGGYQDTEGKKGEGVQHLVVFYQKTCQLCGKTPVKKIILAQRGTYYCPRCQS